MTHCLTVSPSDSIKYHVNNTCTDFIVELVKPIHCDGKMEIAMIEIDIVYASITKTPIRLNVYTDLCVDSNVNGGLSPLLRNFRVRVGGKRQWYQPTVPLYVTMKTSEIKRIRIYIRDCFGNIPTHLNELLACTLHIRPCRI